MTLSVTPTDCGRQIGPDQTEKLMTELKKDALAEPDGAKYWGDRDETLRRQAICHMALVEKDEQGNDFHVRNKPQWNLEAVRPLVTHEQALKDSCNPVRVDPPLNPPKQCPDYIKSVKWVERTDFKEFKNEPTQSLEVVYNDCALKFGEDKTAAVMAEMKQKAIDADQKGAKYWGDKDESMRRQAICLNVKFAGKNPVYLESRRPNGVSQEQVNKMNCNHY